MKNILLVLAVLSTMVYSQTLLAVESFSHARWQVVLENYVDDQGMVDYQGLSNNRELFDQYLETVQTMGPESTPELFNGPADELAYYINAYNALVFDGVLDRGPEDKTVWSGIISGYLFFEWMKIQVDGKKTNLKKLEDDIIRARYKDPRIHAAINCASISCPRLPRSAFLAPTLDQQLEDAMREFANNPSNVLVEDNVIYLSSIFDWFAEDFIAYESRMAVNVPDQVNGRAVDPVINYINRFRAEEDKLEGEMKIKFFPYNKDINKQ